MPYDEHLKQDIGRDFAESSRPAFDATQYLTKSAIQSLVVTNNQIRSEISRFNGDIDRAYNFYSNLYNSEKSKLSSYTSKVADCNYKIIQDKKLLNITTDPLARNRITDRINYNSGLVSKYSGKIEGLKKNCKNYRSILDGLDKIRKSSVKKKLLDSTKNALLKTAKVGKEVAKKTAKVTVDSVEAGVGAGIDATTDSVAAGVSATGVGAPVGIGIKAGRIAGKTAYKTASTTTKGLVHAADKTAMSASKALKESIKLTKIQNLLTGYDDPKEMVKMVGQRGLNLATSTFFTAFNFAVQELIKFILSPVLYIIGVLILAYLIMLGSSIYSTVGGITTVINYVTQEANKNSSEENTYGSGITLAQIALSEYEASWETDSSGNKIRQKTESDGIQNKYIDKYNELASTSLGYGESWCAIFVTYCCNEAGLIDDGTYSPASACSSIISYFENKGLYHSFGDGYSVKVGDLVIHPGHVGIVVEVNGDEVVVVSGNSSNTVGKVTYSNGSITSSTYQGYIEMPFKSNGTKNGESIYMSDDELLDFAAVIAGEAGNDEDGTLAVATVIMNRYEGKGGYASYNYSSIYEVTHASGQFAAVNDATYKSIMNGSVDISSYPNAYSAAKNAMDGYRHDIISEHECVSFRTYQYTDASGNFIDSSKYHPNGINIGGNWFFW